MSTLKRKFFYKISYVKHIDYLILSSRFHRFELANSKDYNIEQEHFFNYTNKHTTN